MSTFAERKAARKAAGNTNKKVAFEVRDSFYGQLVGTFESRKAAESFANEQIGSEVGNTGAYQAWHAMQPRNEVKPFVYFEVTRVEVEK